MHIFICIHVFTHWFGNIKYLCKTLVESTHHLLFQQNTKPAFKVHRPQWKQFLQNISNAKSCMKGSNVCKTHYSLAKPPLVNSDCSDLQQRILPRGPWHRQQLLTFFSYLKRKVHLELAQLGIIWFSLCAVVSPLCFFPQANTSVFNLHCCIIN